MVYKPSNKVLAGLYAPGKGPKGKPYQVWWLDGGVTWEPAWCLETLDRRFMDEMHRRQFNRVKFTGSRGGAGEWMWDKIPGMMASGFRSGFGSLPLVAHQKDGSHCALNSVVNAVFIPPLWSS